MVLSGTSILGAFQIHGYLLVFLLMILEGPIITAGAAFAASLGVFNIWVILFLSIFGNLVPDALLFFIGRFSRGDRVEKFIKRFGITKQSINGLEKGFKNHAWKTITFIKLVPPFPLPGLILTGFARVPIKKFFLIDMTFNLVSSIIATIIGFYFGVAISSVFGYFKISQYAIILLLPLAILFYFFYKKMTKKILEEIN